MVCATCFAQRALAQRGDPPAQRLEDLGLIDPRELPAQVVDPRLRELVGADDGPGGIEGVGDTVAPLLIVALGFQDLRVQRELVLQLLVPLLAQVGRNHDQHATLALGPELGQHQARLDGLAEPHLVGQDDASGERVAAGEQRRFDLVRIQVDLGVDERRAQGCDAVGVRPPGQLPGEELCLMRRKRGRCLHTAGYYRRRGRQAGKC